MCATQLNACFLFKENGLSGADTYSDFAQTVEDTELYANVVARGFLFLSHTIYSSFFLSRVLGSPCVSTVYTRHTWVEVRSSRRFTFIINDATEPTVPL